jgi:hypothetical protein
VEYGEGGFDPASDLAIFFLAGLIKGWCEVMEPHKSEWPLLSAYDLLRIYGMMILWTLGMWWRGMAWDSVQHFLIKDLGVYHGVRLLSWAVMLGLSRLGVVSPRPPRV